MVGLIAGEAAYQEFVLDSTAKLWLIIAGVIALAAIGLGFVMMKGVLAKDTGTEPFEECLPGAGGACRFFWWSTPPTLPTTLAGATTPSVPVNRVLGQIGFGQQDGGMVAPQVGTPYRVFAVFETDDPYGSPCPYPTTGSCVISNLRAIAQ
mgnify:CR=1 FL=1